MIYIKNKFILVILACILLLSSCHSKITGHRILGIWEHENNRIEFTENGYMKKGDKKYKFTVTDKKVTLDKNGKAVVLDYTINSNGTLTLNGLIYYHVKK